MRIQQLLLAVLCALIGSAALADQWLRATPQTYTSSQGSYRLTVFPRKLSDYVQDLEDREKGKAPARRPGVQASCEATLEKLEGHEYRLLWRKPLANPISPVSALVSDKDGSFVTFDNWHSMGSGDRAIVIYSGDGKLKKMFALTSLMSWEEFARLPRSVSSIWWSAKHEMDEDEVVVNVRVVTEGGPADDVKKYRTIRLSLATAQVVQ